MEGFNYLHKLVRTTDFAQQLPESLPIDRVKGLGQIYEYHVEVLMLFSTLLLHLSGREDHVRGASSCTESTLTLRYDVVAQTAKYGINVWLFGGGVLYLYRCTDAG